MKHLVYTNPYTLFLYIFVCYFVLCLMTIQILDFKSIKSLTLTLTLPLTLTYPIEFKRISKPVRQLGMNDCGIGKYTR